MHKFCDGIVLVTFWFSTFVSSSSYVIVLARLFAVSSLDFCYHKCSEDSGNSGLISGNKCSIFSCKKNFLLIGFGHGKKKKKLLFENYLKVTMTQHPGTACEFWYGNDQYLLLKVSDYDSLDTVWPMRLEVNVYRLQNKTNDRTTSTRMTICFVIKECIQGNKRLSQREIRKTCLRNTIIFKIPISINSRAILFNLY